MGSKYEQALKARENRIAAEFREAIDSLDVLIPAAELARLRDAERLALRGYLALSHRQVAGSDHPELDAIMGELDALYQGAMRAKDGGNG